VYSGLIGAVKKFTSYLLKQPGPRSHLRLMEKIYHSSECLLNVIAITHLKGSLSNTSTPWMFHGSRTTICCVPPT